MSGETRERLDDADVIAVMREVPMPADRAREIARLRQALAHVADREKALTTERDRLKLKVEQYQAQLDDKWAGVVALTNGAIDREARLREALRREHARAMRQIGQRFAAQHFRAPGDCSTCALLADPAAGEGRA